MTIFGVMPRSMYCLRVRSTFCSFASIAFGLPSVKSKAILASSRPPCIATWCSDMATQPERAIAARMGARNFMAAPCCRRGDESILSADEYRAPAEMIPARIRPPERPLGRLAFISAFTRNPLEVIPRAVSEEDFLAPGGPGTGRAWITAPAMSKAVLLDQREAFRKTTQIRLLSPLLGKGILTSEGADWKWQRQAAAPMFRPQDLKGFVPAFVRATRHLLARWGA